MEVFRTVDLVNLGNRSPPFMLLYLYCCFFPSFGNQELPNSGTSPASNVYLQSI